MKNHAGSLTGESRIITQLMLHLLPVQILMSAVGMINGTITSLFASNCIGSEAMGAVGLFSPVVQLMGAFNIMLVGGAQILCARYIGKNQSERISGVFSLDIILTAVLSAVFTGALLIMALFNLTGILGADGQIRPLLNAYIIGQSISILPKLLNAHLSAYLSLENQRRRTTVASIVYIFINLLLVYLFVPVMHLGVLGLALAASLGQWVFFLIQSLYYLRGRSSFHFSLKDCDIREIREIFKIGVPGSLSQGYQTIRRFIVNYLVIRFVGNIGLSAFSTVDAFLAFFWAFPMGMLAVSRMLIGISVGEEDRKTLENIMRTVLFCFVPMLFVLAVILMFLADPLTGLYYQNPSEPIYQMVRWGFRILPFSLPLGCICIHFVCYGQSSGKQVLVHLLSLFDGMLCTSVFSAILLPVIGIRGLFMAEVMNGVVNLITVVVYAAIRGRHLPRSVTDLLAMPEEFGVSEENRIDISLQSMKEVVTVSEEIDTFCKSHGMDSRRAFFSALSMEEMAGNVVQHGFTGDRKKHSVDVRVSIKDQDLILRIKDDCRPFDPVRVREMIAPKDPASNIGIRLILRIAKNVSYQNILGLNVLTIRV